jgi:hypothetical protein
MKFFLLHGLPGREQHHRLPGDDAPGRVSLHSKSAFAEVFDSGFGAHSRTGGYGALHWRARPATMGTALAGEVDGDGRRIRREREREWVWR